MNIKSSVASAIGFVMLTAGFSSGALADEVRSLNGRDQREHRSERSERKEHYRDNRQADQKRLSHSRDNSQRRDERFSRHNRVDKHSGHVKYTHSKEQKRYIAPPVDLKRHIKSSHSGHSNPIRREHYVHRPHGYTHRAQHYSRHHFYNHHRHPSYHRYVYRGVNYDAAFLLGGVVLGALLAEVGTADGYYYNDGYANRDYMRINSSACYESFYRNGERVLIEVDGRYCRAY